MRKAFTGTDTQYKRMYELVEKKVQKEVYHREGGINAKFDEDFLRSFLTDKALTEVDKFNQTDKSGITFDTWMKQAIKMDFLDFIRVKKNQIQYGSYEALVESGGYSPYTVDMYFMNDPEMILLDAWKKDTLEEVVEAIENYDLSWMSSKQLDDFDMEYLYVIRLIDAKNMKKSA